MAATPLPKRPLGRTGHDATLFGLGGEGVLRTWGSTSQAVAVIHRALGVLLYGLFGGPPD
jgi:hypothetical protein